MIVFGYEREWSARLPGDNEVWRVLVTTDDKKNVLIWRGHDYIIEKHTISQPAVWDIAWLISETAGLFKINELEGSGCVANDVPCHSFIFSGMNNSQIKYLSTFFFGYTKDGKCPNTDIVVDVTMKVQEKLKASGIPINILEWLTNSDKSSYVPQFSCSNELAMKEIIMQSLSDYTAGKFDIEYLEKKIFKKRGESFLVDRKTIEAALDSLISDGIILRINNPDIYLLNKRLEDVTSLPYSVRDKILLLFSRNPYRRFSFDEIRDKIRKLFDGNPRTETIKANLKNLENDGILLRVKSPDSFAVLKSKAGASKKWNSLSDKEKELLIGYHIGEIVEIVYNGKRRGWKKIRITGQDDIYVFTDEKFSDGKQVMYIKDKILDFRYIAS